MNLALLATNIIGALIYLRGTSFSWYIREEHRLGICSVAGEPVIWALAAFPAFAIFFVLNLVWGIFILRRRDWRWGGRLWLLTALFWIITVWIDFAHHGC